MKFSASVTILSKRGCQHLCANVNAEGINISKQKPSCWPTSSKKDPSASSPKSSTSKRSECDECDRFDAEVDAAVSGGNDGKPSAANGVCYIGEQVIQPKKCKHLSYANNVRCISVTKDHVDILVHVSQARTNSNQFFADDAV